MIFPDNTALRTLCAVEISGQEAHIVKKLLLVVKHEHEMLRFQNVLENYFLGTIHIEAICEDIVVPGVVYNTDVLLTYMDLVHAPVCQSVHYESYIPLTVTLPRSAYPAIMQIPKDELLVLLDDEEDSARQITALIHQLFREDLRFLPLDHCRTVPTSLAFRGDDWFLPVVGDKRMDLVLLEEKAIDRSSLIRDHPSVGYGCRSVSRQGYDLCTPYIPCGEQL